MLFTQADRRTDLAEHHSLFNNRNNLDDESLLHDNRAYLSPSILGAVLCVLL